MRTRFLLFLCLAAVCGWGLYLWWCEYPGHPRNVSISTRMAERLSSEIETAVLYYQKNHGGVLPSRVSDLGTLLGGADPYVSSTTKRGLNLGAVSLRDFPETIEFTGLANFYAGPDHSEFLVVMYGILSDPTQIPVRHWKSGETSFRVLGMEEVCQLIRVVTKQPQVQGRSDLPGVNMLPAAPVIGK